ncbi:hypothetical protein TNCV_334251 [Trichonephila clavipes]|nr:hypothetical protein TNCV_334251 [Trichonephila clavipes]
MGLDLQHLLSYRNDGDDFVHYIVTEDDTSCHHFQPEVRQHAMKSSYSHRQYIFIAQQSARKGQIITELSLQLCAQLFSGMHVAFFMEPIVDIDTPIDDVADLLTAVRVGGGGIEILTRNGEPDQKGLGT